MPLKRFAWGAGGAVLMIAVPHRVAGVLGRSFQTPFADQSGEGLSSSIVTVWWRFASVCMGYPSPGSGSYFPQAVSIDGQRLDDCLPDGAWLIGRNLSGDLPAGLSAVDTGDQTLASFAEPLDRWLAKHNANATLVRPDRYVFGAGEPRDLADAWAVTFT